MSLPKFRLGFDNGLQVCNRFIPLIQAGRNVGSIKIIRRTIRFQLRRLLIIGRGCGHVPLVLFQETERQICFDIIWDPTGLRGQTANRISWLLLVRENSPMAVSACA